MASSDSEDDLITYGTPLEPLEEDEIPKKKPLLLEDQVVKDKQGRRRFHGAFTGGFSAGFFNTVGSLEGWTPSSFKSSRSNKQETLHQRPEDFMDEEDVSEFGISPLVLKAKRDYVTGNKRRLPDFSNASMLGTYVLKNLLQPVRETIGIKLLKKMGWKPGQGVGPHLKKSEKKTASEIRQKRYGCQLPPGAVEDDEDTNSDSEWDNIEFAPNDYEPFLCQVRSNFFGIGYKGLDKRPVLGSLIKEGSNPEEKRRNSKFGSQAFGVGAFEEEDEDIYSKDDMSRYDFSLGSNQPESQDPAEKASSRLNGALEGFTVEKKKPPKKSYLLPVLPRDFKPYHKIRVSRFDQLPPEKEKISKTPKLNFQDRRKFIGEISEEVRERKKQEEESTKELISNVTINTSKFKPFSVNPEKQTRYENYLRLIQIGKKDRLSDLQPLNMSEWDREREKVEFEKAALLFKPLSGGMEDRFLTASQPDDLSDPLAVVEKFHDENDERRKAAKMNMFGSLTRRTEDWIPCQLLCKRFNIPEPKKSHEQTLTVKAEKKTFYLFDAIKTEEEPKKDVPLHEIPLPDVEEHQDNVSEATELRKENVDEPQDKIDIFRAIFLASDDEEKEEEEEETNNSVSKKTESEDLEERELLYEEKVINSKRNLSPPSGIFENINLEALLVRKQNVERDGERREEAKIPEPQKPSESDLLSDLIYGPKIPDKVPVKTTAVNMEQRLDDSVWIEKKSHNKKHKKNKKNKKSSHKSKHKHKKHKK